MQQSQDQQNYQLKIAELQQKVAELQTKYQTQTAIDSNKNATNIAMADINNSSRERIAAIQADAAFTADQAAMAHEQNITALEASQQAEQDIRQHGLEVQQQAFQQQASQVKAQIDAQQQAKQAAQQHFQQSQQAAQQHQQQLVQNDQQHQQTLQQQAVQPQTPTEGQ